MKRLSSTPRERAEWLRHCGLFAALTEADRLALAEFSGLRQYDTGEILFHAGAAADGIHVVVDGLIKVCRFGAEGREQVLHLFGRGEPCGEVAMFEGRTYPATALAMSPSRSLYLARNDFMEAARKQPELLMNMLGLLSRRLRHFVDLIDDLSLKEVSTRLAKRLIELAPAVDAGPIALDISKATLAAQIGTIPETLSRTLARMQQRGILIVEGKHIEIIQRSALESLAEGGKL